MTLKKVRDLGLIGDNTVVWIHDANFHLITRGNWYQDNVLKYMDAELECFTWQDNNDFYLDLK